jgi:hypothetical protein
MLLGILNTKKRVVFIIAAILMPFVFFSRPDYGGVWRCEKIFGFDLSSSKGLKLKPFLYWNFFESPKFRFEILTEDYNGLRKSLSNYGYNEWEEGGLQYGSVNIGWLSDDRVFYSTKQVGKHELIIAIDEHNHIMYAIVAQ